jgi:hypothetical protein
MNEEKKKIEVPLIRKLSNTKKDMRRASDNEPQQPIDRPFRKVPIQPKTP